jgi:hypothetical protein
MTTRQEWTSLLDEFTSVRERVMKIGYELDALHSKAVNASADLGRMTLTSIESAAALTNDLGRIMLVIADRGLAPE